MSDSVNPYQSPEAAIKPENSLGAPGGLTENMVLYLRQASPWLRFIGIVSFIGCGFMVLVGVLSLFLPIFNIWNIEGALAGLIYLGFAVFAFFPARFIYGFGVKIRNFLRSGGEQDLEQAFKYNKSLWKFSGILMIVYLAIVPVAVAIGVIAAVSSSF